MNKMVKLVSQKRSGLFPEFTDVSHPLYRARATIPVVEALQASGAVIVPLELPTVGYLIKLGDVMPIGIVAVHLNEPPHMGLRLESEEPFPMEFPDYWRQVDFTPCPKCGAPVIWYEAGFVPGYRICIKSPYHHSLAK